MNDGPPGEVDGVNLSGRVGKAVHHSVNTPDHVSLREINHQHPEEHEQEDGGKLHAFRDGANNQRGGDNGKHQLIHGKDVLRDPEGIVRVGAGIDVVQKGVAEITQEFAQGTVGFAMMKDQTVPANVPHNSDHAGNQKALGHDGEDVFAPHQTAIKQG